MPSARLEWFPQSQLTAAVSIAGSGPPLFLLHGAEGDHHVFDDFVSALGAGFTTYAYDQRDCGETTLEVAAPYGLDELAGDAAELILSLGLKRAHVLGNSIGGVIAQILAARWPDRVARLVLAVSFPANVLAADLNPRGIRRRAELITRGDEGALELAELFSTPDYVAAHPEFVEELRRLRGRSRTAGQARRAEAFTRPAEIELSAIRAPTLVIAGERDQVIPSDASALLAAQVPGARFKIIPEVGHLAVREATAHYAGLVREFLND
jgi:pimeloyl-ACP methyl ester carboxylesterase